MEPSPDSAPVPPHPLVLAIESSCDETSVALLDGRSRILAEKTRSQIAEHRPYGGVVPELASRNHTLALPAVLEAALAEAPCRIDEVDVFAATSGPGLASALLVGNTTAKALALASGRPFLAINHLEGHLLSAFFGELDPPDAVVLVASGGHTLLARTRGVGCYERLGSTRDDAAGEAFDKAGRMLGLPYPGGPEIDRHAADGDPAAFAFPRSLSGESGWDFSFSGLKTALRVCLEKMPAGEKERRLPDLCASFQEAILDVLVAKSLAAARQSGTGILAVGGGVACNRRLRVRLEEEGRAQGVRVLLTPASLATDNAAMIGYAALLHHLAGHSTPLDADIDPNMPLPGLGVLRGQAARRRDVSGS